VPSGREAFIAYSNAVCVEMLAKVSGPAIESISGGDAFAIFGHAVFLNAVAYLIADAWSIQNLDDILGLDLGEAEALVLDSESGIASHLHPSRK
jgi:hypothetical protein